MLRGFRWQLIALIVAALLFAATLVTRLTDTAPEALPATAAPTLTPEPTIAPTLTPGVLLEPETPASGVVTFREGLIGTVQRLNPLLANPAERDITALIFEGLTRSNQYGEPEPALAESWSISPNGLEYVVTLRDDVLWQDGIPFNAADVMFTMQLLRSPDFPGDAALGDFWRTVETEQLGPHLLRFRLTQPLGSFLDKLRIGILPAHALQGIPAADLLIHPFNLAPIGTGPYQLEALRSSSSAGIQQVDLRAAPVYRVQTGYGIDRLSFVLYPDFNSALSAFNSGDLEGLVAPSRHERSPLLTANDASAHTALEPTLGILIYNWQRDETRYFREQRVRLALEAGIDRDAVVERWLLNQAVFADSPLWPGSWAYDPIPQQGRDIDVARFLLDTANLNVPTNAEATEEAEAEPTEASPYLLEFSILTPDDPRLVSLLEEIAAQWSQLNISVRVETAAAANYQARLESGDFDMALVELSLGDSADPDVYHFWHQGQYPDGLNYGGMNDSRISEVLEKARRDPSGINRSIHYEQFQSLFAERAIAIPLYYPLFTYITAAKVSGVQLGFIGTPTDRFRTLQDWAINP